MFRRVHANSANLFHGRSPLFEICNDLILAQSMPSGAVHPNTHAWFLLSALKNIFQSSENRAIARCTRKTRQLDFSKAEAKLIPAGVCGRAPSGIRGCRLMDGHWRGWPLAPLLSRPLWLYSRAMQTEVLADASL
jgi:hypothetical protein